MAIRLATLAMVPVKRFWSAVKPVSNGEPLDWASATAGNTVTIKNKLNGWRIRRSRIQIMTLCVAKREGREIIGTSDGVLPFCAESSAAFSSVQDFLSMAP
jgi:hypothetical protein